MKKKYIFVLIIAIIVISVISFEYYNYKIMMVPRNAFKEKSNNFTDNNNDKTNFNSDKIYIAFLGLDKTDERIKTIGNFRTDTIAIFSIDLKTKKVNLLSIPRDTYVEISGQNGKDKINAAYVYGGMGKKGYDTSLKTISNFLGINVTYYMSIDMQIIPQIVDAVGGVPLTVEEDMHTQGANLNKGYQVLDGIKAEQYIRWRYDPMGDINRVKRQQNFMLAFMKKLHSSTNDISSYIKLYNAFNGQVYTNLNFQQIVVLMGIFKDVKTDEIKIFIVPGDFYDYNDISYWKPDVDKLNAIIQEFK
jgi:LCP family protein required for cell wall assembly